MLILIFERQAVRMSCQPLQHVVHSAIEDGGASRPFECLDLDISELPLKPTLQVTCKG